MKLLAIILITIFSLFLNACNVDKTVEVFLEFKNENVCASAYGAETEGESITEESWFSTDNINLDGCYGISYELSAHKNLMSVAFYDVDGNYISGVGTTSMLKYATTVCGFVIRPQNATTARFINFTGSDDMPVFDTANVTLYKSRKDYESESKKGAFNGMKIVCIGDSLTEGDYGGKKGVANRKFKNYPYFLSKITGAQTVNFGKCGANATSYLNNFYNEGLVDVTDADVVLLMLGTNLGLKKGSDFYNDYIILVESVQRDMKSDAKLILITPPNATMDKTKVNFGYMKWVETAYNSVKEIAKDKGLDIIDAFSLSPIQPETEEIYQPADGLHMNEAGYEVFAQFLAEEIGKIIG